MNNNSRNYVRIGLITLSLGFALFETPSLQASPMDFAPERLSGCANSNIPCGAVRIVNDQLVTNYIAPDNAAWAKLVSQYGAAIAPMAMRPARTTGYGGLEVSLFGSYTTISSGENFMKRGTEGSIDGNKYPTSNAAPDSVLQVYGLTARKGLPFGFELEASVGHLVNTELMLFGGGFRFSLLEGFRKNWQAFIPDISIGGAVHTLVGSSKVKITVPSVDVQISKPIVVGQRVVIQPYVGWQMYWILADSGVVDGTPNRDALRDCNARPSTPNERSAGDTGEYHCQEIQNGTPTDATTSSASSLGRLDTNNNMVFQNVRFTRQRLMLGTSVRYEYAHALLHVMTDLVKPENGGDERIRGLAGQWTVGLMIGLSW